MTAQRDSSSLRRRFCYLPPQTKHDYGSAERYCEAVRSSTARNFYKQAQSEYQDTVLRQRVSQVQAFTVQNGGVPNIHIQINRVAGGAYIQVPNATRIVTGNYRPASFIKRILAEMIDFVIFFCFKLFIVWLCIEQFELIDLDEFESLLGNQADLQSLIDVTQSLFPYELLSKIFVTLLEAYCISFRFLPGFPLGATPGKILIGIRVISATTTAPTNGIPGQITVTGYERVPFKNALLRSLVKNLFINSLLPLSTVAFAFRENRSAYDLMAKTIVVEAH